MVSQTMRHVQSCKACRAGKPCEWGRSIACGEFGASVAWIALEKAAQGQDVGEPS